MLELSFNYAKEDRLAYRLFVGAITKKNLKIRAR